MLRQAISAAVDHDPHFHWRGDSVTRIENLSDIVFALALGMMVSASTPPETFTALQGHMINIIPVAGAFALLLSIWNSHFTFFRRYGLADATIIGLNAALLMFILFIAYPLRFIFDSLFAFILGQMGDWSRMEAMGVSTHRQAGIIMGWYFAGYVIIRTLMTIMYAHALSKADVLSLTPSEKVITRRSIWFGVCAVLVSSIAGAASAFSEAGPWAGFLLTLLLFTGALIDRLKPLPSPEPDSSL